MIAPLDYAMHYPSPRRVPTAPYSVDIADLVAYVEARYNEAALDRIREADTAFVQHDDAEAA